MLLDCFGTLVAMEPPAPHLQAELARTAGLEVSEEEAEAAFRAEITHYLAHHLEGSDAASLDRLRDDCAEVIRTALGRPRGVERRAVREAMLAAIRFHPFPDAAPALRALRDRGIRLVVASNWDASLPEVLERVGLAPLLDGVVASAMVGRAKPAPELFHAALELAGVEPGRALYVGDSLDHDAIGARAAGLRPVLIERPAPGEYGLSRSAHGAIGGGAAGVPIITSLEALHSVR